MGVGGGWRVVVNGFTLEKACYPETIVMAKALTNIYCLLLKTAVQTMY